LIAYELIRHST